MSKFFKFLIIFLLFFLLISYSDAQEINRVKNTATRIEVKFRNSSTGAFISSAADMACVCKLWTDAANPADLTTPCATAAPTEISSTGVYYLPLTAAETNGDFVTVLCTTSTADAIPFEVSINTKSDPTSALNVAVPTSPTSASVFSRLKNLSDSTGLFGTGSTTSALQLAATETANNITGETICVDTGTAAKDCARIISYDTSTKIATVAPALTAAPANADAYSLIGDAPTQISGTKSTLDVLQDVSATAVTNAVWDSSRAAHVQVGSFGQGVITYTNSDKTGYSISGTKTTLDALNDISTANVLTQATAALNSYDAPTQTEMTAAFTAIKGSGWSGSTDTLVEIRDNIGAGAGSCDADDIADHVWDKDLSAYITEDLAGTVIKDAASTTLTCTTRRQ